MEMQGAEFAFFTMYVSGEDDFGALAAEDYGIERLFLEEIQAGYAEGDRSIAARERRYMKAGFTCSVSCTCLPNAKLRREIMDLVKDVVGHVGEYDYMKHDSVYLRLLTDDEYRRWKRPVPPEDERLDDYRKRILTVWAACKNASLEEIQKHMENADRDDKRILAIWRFCAKNDLISARQLADTGAKSDNGYTRLLTDEEYDTWKKPALPSSEDDDDEDDEARDRCILAIWMACAKGDLEEAQRLDGLDADIAHPLAIWLACAEGDFVKAQYLIDGGSESDERDKDGKNEEDAR